jgi:hypothetical protein
MREYIKPFVTALWLLLSGCSSSPELPITPEKVQSLTDVDQLQDLHGSLSTQLAGQDPEEFPAEFALLKEVDQRLVELHKNRLGVLFEAKRIYSKDFANGLVPLPELAQIKQELTDLMSSASQLLPLVSAPIHREEAATGKLIAQLTAESNTPEISAERRAVVYDLLYKVSGDVVWQKGRDNQMDVIVKAIHAATTNNIFNQHLEEKVDFVRSIYVNQPEKVINDMQGVYANMYAHRFFAAVRSGNPAAAYNTLQDLSLKPDYEAIRTKLQPSAMRMAAYFSDYFAAIVDQDNDLGQSFLYHGREMEARRILGLQPQVHPKTSALTHQLFEKFKTLESKKSHFAALGVLYAIEIIEPKFSGLPILAAQQEALIKESTIRSVSLTDFRSRYKEHNYGAFITPLIAQHLTEAVGNEIQLVRQDVNAGDVNVDALISGNVLEVKVDSSKTPNKRRLQTTVGDIFITSTLHRKAAVFAVSYRLATVGNDPIIFPDSITLQAQYEDESNEGVEVGELVIPYKVAKLPADEEILEKLAREVAGVIAGNLAAILQNQEVEYLKIADRFANEGDCKKEVEGLAKAIALMHVKNLANEKMSARLGERSLTCF